MEWVESKNLKDYIQQIRGVTYKREDTRKISKKGYVPVIRANNLQQGKFDYSNLVYVKSEKVKEQQVIKEGDIIIASSSGSKHIVGKAAQAVKDMNYSFGAFCKLIRPNEKISSNYLGHYFNSNHYRKTISSLSEGANINNLRNEHIDNLQILVPPIESQIKIVKVLDKAQKLIDHRKEQIGLLRDLIESVFYDMFGDPVTDNKGWTVKKLSELIEINPRKSEVIDMKDSDLEITFLPMDKVLENGQIILEETRKISEVYKGYTYFKENDVLFAKITPCMENGKGCIAKGLVNNIGFGSTEFHILRAKDDILIEEFIFYLTKSKRFREKAESNMTGSAGQKRVPKKFLEDYIINVPPLPLQTEFAKRVELIEKQKRRMEESLRLMENNYQGLMQKAFKGELF